MNIAHPVRVCGLVPSNQHAEMATRGFACRYVGLSESRMLLDALGSSWCSHYPWGVDVAWRWLVGGVLAIGVGLAVWPTTFILVPAGVVLAAIGVTKWVRSIRAAHARSR